MSYIIKRTDQGGGYVAPPGHPRSYTWNPSKAKRFSTRREADMCRCVENELVVNLRDELGI